MANPPAETRTVVGGDRAQCLGKTLDIPRLRSAVHLAAIAALGFESLRVARPRAGPVFSGAHRCRPAPLRIPLRSFLRATRDSGAHANFSGGRTGAGASMFALVVVTSGALLDFWQRRTGVRPIVRCLGKTSAGTG